MEWAFIIDEHGMGHKELRTMKFVFLQFWAVIVGHKTSPYESLEPRQEK